MLVDLAGGMPMTMNAGAPGADGGMLTTNFGEAVTSVTGWASL